MPASPENDSIIQSTRSDKSSLTSDGVRSLVDTQVAESIQKILPHLLKESLQRSGVIRGIVDPLPDEQVEVVSYERPSKRHKSNENCNEGPSGRSKRF